MTTSQVFTGINHVDLKRMQDAAIASQDFGNLFKANPDSPGLWHLRRQMLSADAVQSIRGSSERATDFGVNVNIGRDSMIVLVERALGTPVLHPWKAKYFDQLISNPALHDALKPVLDSELELRAGRVQAPTDGMQSVDGYREAIAKECVDFSPSRPVTVGVSALIVARDSGDEIFGLVSKRSESVALNPGVLTSSVEGGLSASKDPLEQLENEARDELRNALQNEGLVEWSTLEPAALFVPGDEPLKLVSGAQVARVGVSAIYLIDLGDVSRLQAVCDATCSAIDRENSGDKERGFKEGDPELLNLRELLGDPSVCISESLAAAAVLALGDAQGGSATDPEVVKGARATALNDGELVIEGSENASSSSDSLTANQRFADSLLLRFPHLKAACERLEDFQESSFSRPERGDKEFQYGAAAAHALRVLIEFDLLADTELGHTDRGRLYEAVVYQVHRYIFSSRAHQAKSMVEKLTSEPQARAVMGFDIVSECMDFAMSVGVPAEELSEVNSSWRRDDFLRRSLKKRISLGECESLRAAMQRLAFSCAVVQMEIDQDPGAAQYVFSGDNREPFAGDPIALYYKAKGIAVSPVLPMSQLVVGFQFALMAVSHYPRHAGMHHVVARYELRIADGEMSSEGRESRHLSALERVNRAIELDPEVADFYLTRARIRKLRGEKTDARIDVESAIELERFVTNSDEARMKNLLDVLESYSG